MNHKNNNNNNKRISLHTLRKEHRHFKLFQNSW